MSTIILVVKLVILFAVITLFVGLSIQIDFSLIYDILDQLISMFNQITNAIFSSIGNYPELYIMIIFFIALAIISFLIRLLKGDR